MYLCNEALTVSSLHYSHTLHGSLPHLCHHLRCLVPAVLHRGGLGTPRADLGLINTSIINLYRNEPARLQRCLCFSGSRSEAMLSTGTLSNSTAASSLNFIHFFLLPVVCSSRWILQAVIIRETVYIRLQKNRAAFKMCAVYARWCVGWFLKLPFQ